MTREQVQEALTDGSILSLLNWIPVEDGKAYYIPVSYTHLDVYKRQAVQRAAESVAKEKKIQDLRQESIKWNQNRKILQQDIWKNVLKDVYKRQVIFRCQISYRVASQNPAIIQPSKVTQHDT